MNSHCDRSTYRLKPCSPASWLIPQFALATLIAIATTFLPPQLHAQSSDEELRADGLKIYQTQCASCHGDQGEGSDDGYAKPLQGDDSIGELADLISDTMPEEDPGLCVAQDATAVAAYIHHAFYSEAARIRNRPPTRTLSRLTASQMRQSYADLYAHFHGVAGLNSERGLKAIYFTGQRWNDESKKLERVDPTLDFDFGNESPVEGVDATDFFINWSGGLIVKETGVYELVIRSTCSFVMDFGTRERELINNHVQSGDKTEFRRTLRLVAGRVYPLEINFRQRPRKTEQPPASISFSWVPPHGVETTVPTDNLMPNWTPPTYALQTILPPDDRSYGYERGIAVSRQWDEATTSAAIEFSEIVESELWPAYQRKHKDAPKDPEDPRALLKQFLTELVATAFRQPLDDASRTIYVDKQFAATQDDSEAIKRVLLIALKSPRFLYPPLGLDRTPSQQAAASLALTLFDSLPSDEWLLKARDENRLVSEDEIRQAAQRMVRDYRTNAKAREMMFAWLNLSHFGELNKDDGRFPGFSPELASQLRGSLVAFLDEIVQDDSSDFRDLFLADRVYTTPQLAEYYGAPWQPQPRDGVGFATSNETDIERYGVLTHPYLMSGLAYHDSTSPIHRGVFVIRYLLGRTLRPPNDAFSPLSPDLHPDLTTRERVELQTSPESCQVCHSKINALGFTLENYDAVGRFRIQDNEKPVKTDGFYIDRDGEQIQFAGPDTLARYLADSHEAQQAFVARAFQHFVKQPIAAYGTDTLDQLTERFQNSGYNIRTLLVEIAVIAATQPPITSEEES